MRHLMAILLLAVLVWECSHQAEPIHYGQDQCAFCKMTIEDPKFGAEIMTSKGRTYKFDAIECLVSGLPDYSNVNVILVTPFDKVGTLVPIDSVVFLKSESIKSPMGGGLAAFLSKEKGAELASDGNNQWLNWNEVKSRSWQ
jgi:copper chaperone NosL